MAKRFFSNLLLSQQIAFGFGSVLLLTVLISLLAYIGLTRGYANFLGYRALTEETVLAASLQAEMLAIRISALKYVDQQNQQALDNYQYRVKSVEALLGQAQTKILDLERRRNLDEAEGLIRGYREAFNGIIQIVKDRQLLIETIVYPNGVGARTNITKIMQLSYEQKDESNVYHVAKAQEALLLARLYMMRFLSTGVEADINRVYKELKEVDEHIGLVSRTDSRLNNLIATTQQMLGQYTQAVEGVHKKTLVINRTLRKDLDVKGPVVADLLEKIKIAVAQEQDMLGDDVQIKAQRITSFIIVFSVVSILMGVVFSVFLSKLIRLPIGGEPRDIEKITRDVAGGDLTFSTKPGEQHSGIYGSITVMTKNLQQVICAISSAGQAIYRSGQNVFEVAQKTGEAVSWQKCLTEQMATSMNELVASFESVVRNAEDSAAEAEKARGQAATGRDRVRNTEQAIEKMADRVSETVGVIQLLEQSSSEIDSVVEVIHSISEQTNLLALNAAIEAARAGEQGRGFAVVADEVRALAQRTSESTSEIQAIIQKLQKGASTAVVAMEESKDHTKSTVEMSKEARTCFEEIMNSISQIADRNSQVEAALREQFIVAEDVNQKIHSIATTSESTENTSKNMLEESTMLNERSQEMLDVVGQFRVG